MGEGGREGEENGINSGHKETFEVDEYVSLSVMVSQVYIFIIYKCIFINSSNKFSHEIYAIYVYMPKLTKNTLHM